MPEKKTKKGGNGEDKELKDKAGGMDENLSDKTTKETQSEEEKRKEEELIREFQEKIDQLTTKDILIQMMMSLSSLAYKKMGLPVGTNDKYKDKMQAKMAIDSFDALLKVIADEISAEETENLRSSLSNLQVNFVRIFI
ncbi:MAG: DUF1844 domain-containing protein [Actinobacteria bacterium]|nr:DUF1844 domain-containing protein [Actinomycetota bacterium]